MRLAENTEGKKVAINRYLDTIAQLFRATSSQLRHILTIRKHLLSSNMSSRCPHSIVNLAHEWLRSVYQFGAPQIISMAFTSCQRYCTAVK